MNNWKEYHIKDLGTVITGNTPPTTQREYYGNEYKFIKPTDMIEGQRFVDSTEESLSDLGYQKYKKSLLPKFTPCVVTIGSLGKKMCLTDCECFTNQAVNAVIPNKNNDGIFLYYAFKATVLAYVKQLDSGTSSGRENVSKSSFSNIKITVPPFPTQQKIAGILSKYDEAIENNNKRIKLLEQMAQNLYKEWFVRFRFPGWQNAEFENGIPKGWKVEKLEDFSNVVMGQSPESEFYNSEKIGLPFHQGVGSYGDFYLKDEIYSSQGNRIAEANSIIFSVRAPVGRINISLNKIILGRGVASINSKNGFNAFLFWMLKEMFKKEDVIGNGSIFTSVTKDELLKQKLIIPDEKLLKKANAYFDLFEKQIRNLTQQTQNLSRQRDLLLPRLMSGKLQVFRK